ALSGLRLLVVAVRQYWRARRRLSRPKEMPLTEWPDRLAIVGNGLPRELPFLDIRESLLGRTHLFLVSDHGMLIPPSRVFPEAGVIEALAARIAGRPALAPVDAAAGEA